MNGYAILRFLAAVCVSASLIAADLQWRAFDSLRGELSQVLLPFRYAAGLPERAYSTVRDYFRFRENLLAEKKALEDQLLQQTVRLNSLDFFVEQNDEMRKLLGLAPELEENWIAADVRPETPRIQQERIYLDRGADNGVSPGMTVVDEKGVVGQIVRVDADSSVVNLLSNTRQWIAVRVERTGQFAVVRGNGGGLEVDSMPGDADVRPGDILRAEGGVFPGGYPVGTIEEVARGVRYLSARVSPASDFYRRRILLIYSAAPEEIQ